MSLLWTEVTPEGVSLSNLPMNDEYDDISLDVLKHRSNSDIYNAVTEQNNILETILIVIMDAIPISLDSVFAFLLETINILFIGHLKDYVINLI